jgi:hypothetical protein
MSKGCTQREPVRGTSGVGRTVFVTYAGRLSPCEQVELIVSTPGGARIHVYVCTS